MVREQSMMIAEEFRCASAAGEKRGSWVIAITHRIADFHIDGACADPVDLQRGGGLLGKLCAMAAGIANIFDKGGPRVRLAHYEAADARHAVALGPVHPLRKRGGRKTDGDGGQSEVAEQTAQEQRLSSEGSAASDFWQPARSEERREGKEWVSTC